MADRDLSRPLAVPASRAGRMARLGGMASGVAGRMALDGARALARGERPVARDLLLTASNIRRVTDRLATMRGAAMKVGQLVSLDAGEVLTPELSQILSRLRADADFMPPKQLKQVLTRAWGEGWIARFRRFDVRPVAAASIGQVHRAQTRDGRDLAIKVQYPGVRRAIDSDVDNVATLIRMSGLLPRGLDVRPLLSEAKAQLHEEANYAAEAHHLEAFRGHLAGDERFVVPAWHPDLSTGDVLAMDFIDSAPIETLETTDQVTRDGAAEALLGLTLRELFDLRLIQTDPNFANYRVAPDGRIVLLDFGATRVVPEALSDAYLALMRDGVAGRFDRLDDLAVRIGFYGAETETRHRDMIVDMMRVAFAELSASDTLDFGDRTLAAEMQRRGEAMARDGEFWHVPPADTLFVQRKLGGLYLLAARLRARIDLSALIAPWR